MKENMLSSSEAADYLGVKLGTIYHWTYQGKLHPKKFAKQSRYLVSELKSMLDDALGTNSATITIDQDEFIRQLEPEFTPDQIQKIQRTVTACATVGNEDD